MMNRMISLISLSLVSFLIVHCFVGFVSCTSQSRPPLRFRPIPSDPSPPLSASFSSFVFRIVQFTDLHYGEGEQDSWGPEQDRNSTRVMRSVLQHELKGDGIDLIAYTGDLITGNNIHSNATVYWNQLLQPALDNNLPWAILFGNHDDLSDGEGGRREDLMKFDTSFPNSYSQFGPENIKGVSNYLLNIHAPSNDGIEGKENNRKNDIGNVWTNLVFLDTGGGQLPETIDQNQVDWYMKINQPYSSLSIPSFVFFHIPIEQYSLAYRAKYCIGLNDDDISPVTNSSSLYTKLQENGVLSTFVGHQHGEGWCCPFPPPTKPISVIKKGPVAVDQKSLSLCFGRHTGYGGYGHWTRGGRIIEIHADLQLNGQVKVYWTSYIRMEDGSMIDQYTPQ